MKKTIIFPIVIVAIIAACAVMLTLPFIYAAKDIRDRTITPNQALAQLQSKGRLDGAIVTGNLKISATYYLPASLVLAGVEIRGNLDLREHTADLVIVSSRIHGSVNINDFTGKELCINETSINHCLLLRNLNPETSLTLAFNRNQGPTSIEISPDDDATKIHYAAPNTPISIPRYHDTTLDKGDQP